VPRQKCQEGYDRNYLLREEAREFWDHAVTEEFVYVPNLAGTNEGNSCIGIAKDYLEGNLWVHIQFSLFGQWNAKYDIITELFSGKSPRGRREFDGDREREFFDACRDYR
jgi:hypothetical protein